MMGMMGGATLYKNTVLEHVLLVKVIIAQHNSTLCDVVSLTSQQYPMLIFFAGKQVQEIIFFYLSIDHFDYYFVSRQIKSI